METDELAKLKDKVKDLGARVVKLEGLFLNAPPSVVKPESIREFVLRKGPKSAVGRAAVIGYFISEIEGRGSFDLKDIKEGFRLAKEKIPGNPSEAIRQNEKHGYFTETKTGLAKNGTTRWSMTNAGIYFVEGLGKTNS